MLRFGDQLANHGLNNTNVAVQETTQGASEQRNPQVLRKTDHDHAEHGADAAQQQDWFTTDAIRQAAPVHAHQGLGQGEGRDEQPRIEGSVIFVADLEALDERPGVGEDGGERDGLGEADDGCGCQFCFQQKKMSKIAYLAGKAGRWESHPDYGFLSAWLESSLLGSVLVLRSRQHLRG
jgi:hypothetical protein